MMAVSHLSGSLLAQQVAGGGLDQPGQHEAGAVALVQDHELVLEELPAAAGAIHVLPPACSPSSGLDLLPELGFVLVVVPPHLSLCHCTMPGLVGDRHAQAY